MTLIQIDNPKPATKPRSRPGRKSELERIATKHEVEKESARLAALAEIEAKRAVRVQPDTTATQRGYLIGSGIALSTAFLVSYFTLVDVAHWMILPWEPLRYIVPGFIEVIMVLSYLDSIISESNEKGSGKFPFRVGLGVTGIAILAQTIHTIVGYGDRFGGANLQSWVGVGLSAVVPLAVAYISKRLTATVFAKPEGDRQ